MQWGLWLCMGLCQAMLAAQGQTEAMLKEGEEKIQGLEGQIGTLEVTMCQYT